MINTIESLNKKCIKGLPKQFLSVLVYSAKKLVKQICRAKNLSKRMKELVDSAKCLNKAHNQIQKCYDTAIDNFLGIKNLKNQDNLKIPMACW
jgi:hypothetical protein